MVTVKGHQAIINLTSKADIGILVNNATWWSSE